MSGEPQRTFPRGFIAMGNGDLMQVVNVKVSTTNGAKQSHTLRRSGAGIVFGPEESTVTFDANIDESGSERDYMRLLQEKQIKQIRIKVPGQTLTCSGAVQTVDEELPIDAEIKFSVTFVGKVERS